MPYARNFGLTFLTLAVAACGASSPPQSASISHQSQRRDDGEFAAPALDLPGNLDVTHQGAIEREDRTASDGRNQDTYSFDTIEGMPMTIDMVSTDLDAQLALVGPDGTLIATDDDGYDGGTNASIRLVAPSTGTYTVIARAFDLGEFGEYSLQIQCGQELTSASICTNTCATANDGECDDGGSDSRFAICQLGTDCGDCGSRIRAQRVQVSQSASLQRAETATAHPSTASESAHALGQPPRARDTLWARDE